MGRQPKKIVGEHKKSKHGNYGTWKCNECGNSSLDKYKKCMNCFKGLRPEFDEDRSGVRILRNKTDDTSFTIIDGKVSGESGRAVQANDLYEVSSRGRVRRTYSKLMKTPSKTEKGYLKVKLFVGKCGKSHLVHRLVGEAFIPNPENKPQINHINGIKTDNTVKNLEWATALENVRHAIETGLTNPNRSRKR